MLNNILKLIYIIILIIIIWFTISWIEVLFKNLNGININSWNFFSVLPKIF